MTPVRPIDHLVLGTADLEAAATAFAAYGFQVGSRNRHPFGTQNRIIQLAERQFLELISVADASLIVPHQPRRFSFAAFVADAIGQAPGLSMLVLASQDARADALAFRAAGIGDFEPFDFTRKARRPDGSDVEVAFSLAFAAEAAMPRCGFFTCQHHRPENFWNPAAQAHANTALGIGRVTIVAENPSDHHIFLEAFTGARELRSTSFGIEARIGLALVEIISAEGFAMRYGQAAPASESPVFAGFSLRIAAMEALSACMAAGHHALDSTPYGLVLPPTPQSSTAILFEKA